jgi:hypothetical protein
MGWGSCHGFCGAYSAVQAPISARLMHKSRMGTPGKLLQRAALSKRSRRQRYRIFVPAVGETPTRSVPCPGPPPLLVYLPPLIVCSTCRRARGREV